MADAPLASRGSILIPQTGERTSQILELLLAEMKALCRALSAVKYSCRERLGGGEEL